MTDDHSGEAGRPDPATVDTPAEFVDALRRLQRWTGQSYRQLEKRARDAGAPLPRSTLTAALARDTLPREGVVVAFVQACGGGADEVRRWVTARRRIASAPDPDRSDPSRSGTDPTSLILTRARPSVRTVTAVLVAVLAVSALAVTAGRILTTPAEANPHGGTTGLSGEVAATAQAPRLGKSQPCPEGWFCLYEHPHFSRDGAGRMLQFQDDYWQPLKEWEFDNQTSSARNHLGRDACLSADWPVGARKIRLAAGDGEATVVEWDDQLSGIKPGPC